MQVICSANDIRHREAIRNPVCFMRLGIGSDRQMTSHIPTNLAREILRIHT